VDRKRIAFPPHSSMAALTSRRVSSSAASAFCGRLGASVHTDFYDLPQALQEHYLALGIVQPFIVAER
jgi:hypothetical protein